MNAERFLDTNVLLYLFSEDAVKADCAESIVNAGAVISVQVLNEFTSVARRKLKLEWLEIDEALRAVQACCAVQPLTVAGHTQGRWLAQRYILSIYDAMIVSSALEAECTALFTEDMQDGMQIMDQLTIRDPFRQKQ